MSSPETLITIKHGNGILVNEVFTDTVVFFPDHDIIEIRRDMSGSHQREPICVWWGKRDLFFELVDEARKALASDDHGEPCEGRR